MMGTPSVMRGSASEGGPGEHAGCSKEVLVELTVREREPGGVTTE